MCAPCRDKMLIHTVQLRLANACILWLSINVWIFLVRDLARRTFVDTLPGQNFWELSTTELINLAKRTVQGPKSWSPPYSHTVSREHILHLGFKKIPDMDVTVKLLPGGRCVMLSGMHYLLCGLRFLHWPYNGDSP